MFKTRCAERSGLFLGCGCQFGDYFFEAGGYAGEGVVINFVRGVVRGVVVRVAEWGGVGYHNSGVAVSPERPVV